jgi:hypothetical protein
VGLRAIPRDSDDRHRAAHATSPQRATFEARLLAETLFEETMTIGRGP